MRKVRWGVLGTANIARKAVIPGIRGSKSSELVAVASRDAERAARYAAELGVPHAYGSYEDLLAAPDVDAVYIPLPNHLHVPWSVRALEAGKHVLCEKPVAMTASEAEELAAAADEHSQLKVMEAFMYRHHPQWHRAKELAASGALGRLQAVQVFFSYRNFDPDNVRNQNDIGGGGLLDIGCYAVSAARYLFGAEPERVVATIDRDPGFGTDRLASGLLQFGDRAATFAVGTQLVPYQRVNVVGDAGRVEVEIPFNAPPDRECRIWVQGPAERTVTSFAPVDQYVLQVESFARSILGGAPVATPLSDAVANMRVIDALFESARTGGWVNVAAG